MSSGGRPVSFPFSAPAPVKIARPVKRFSLFHTMTFHSHFLLCALTALAGWLTGRIASRASRIPGFTFGD